jgi:hypothetical protein
MLLSSVNQIDPYQININWYGKQHGIDSLFCFYSPTLFFMGEDELHPKQGKWSARELRNKLELFKNEIQNEYHYPIAFNQIDCADGFGYDKTFSIKETWETYSFYHAPLIECLKKLKNIQIEIKKISISTKTTNIVKKKVDTLIKDHS